MTVASCIRRRVRFHIEESLLDVYSGIATRDNDDALTPAVARSHPFVVVVERGRSLSGIASERDQTIKQNFGSLDTIGDYVEYRSAV